MANSHMNMKRCSASLEMMGTREMHQGNTNQNQVYYVTPTSMNIIIIKKRIISVGEESKKWNLHTLLMGL